MNKAFPVLTNEITKKVSKEGAKGQNLSQGKGFYLVLGQKFQPVKNLNSRK